MEHSGVGFLERKEAIDLLPLKVIIVYNHIYQEHLSHSLPFIWISCLGRSAEPAKSFWVGPTWVML